MKAAPRGKTALAPRANQMAAFSTYITAPATTKMLEKVFSDSNRVTRLVSTLVSAVSSSDALRACKPETILSAALKGEANNLNLSLGHFYLVPYGNVCTYIPSHKGLIQLAIRTGLYEDLDVLDIREGEYRGRDEFTGKPIIRFEIDDAKRERLPICGYYSFFRLKIGFAKSFYWSMEKILEHADRYSKAFDLEIYEKYKSGAQLNNDEQRQVDNGPWYGKTGAQDSMCKKTLMKALLNSGYAPLSAELQAAIESDEDENDVAEAISREMVNESTPSTSDEPIPVSASVADEDAPESNMATPNEEPRRRPKKAAQANVNAYDAFFGGVPDDNNTEE